MVLSVYHIGEMREIEPPSDGKGSGALCAVVDIDGEIVPACSVHLNEVDPKVRNAERDVVFSAESPHRLHLCIPQDNGRPSPGAAPYASSQGSGHEEFGTGSAGVSPAEDAMGLRVAGGTPALPGYCPPDCGVMRSVQVHKIKCSL